MSKGRKVLCEKVLRCQYEAAIVDFLRGMRPFRAVVEATASYEWLVRLIEPLSYGTCGDDFRPGGRG